ncbi:hypothetical protein [Geodermatophilus sp. CPCC 206100]|uniref:hypothetical protein n=1 Tax=Geodermatophilus sp. CPCC 206100 TaxID=3020054 RepID=UPI003AFFC247
MSHPPSQPPFPPDQHGPASWPAGPQETAPLLAAEPPQKPFLKRPWVWGVAAALVVGIGIGNASAGSDEVASGEAAATSTSRSTAASSTPAPPPSVAPLATVAPPATVAPTPSPTMPPPPPTTPPPPVVDFPMPGLVGLDLQTAQNTVQTFGVFFSRSHDLLGSRSQAVDSNWVVCTQNVPPGQRVTGNAEGLIDLGVVKREESCP